MANRRMFAKSVTDSDNFLDMPSSAQALYFHLCMHADDDGFLDNHKSTMRNVKANDDDLKLLIAKGFLLVISPLLVVTHWKLNNQIQKDRYKPTIYTNEKALLHLSKSGVYILDTKCIQNVSKMDTQYSIVEDSIVENSIYAHASAREAQTQFTPPTVDKVQAYCNERNNGIDAQLFVSYYDGRGWTVGKNNVAMKDWRAIIRYWERNKDVQAMQKPKQALVSGVDIERRQYTQEQINKLFTVLDEDE